MGQVREVDAISDAIIATEREIAGEAWGNEETDALDESGDRSLESIGEGLEGQHDAEEDESETEASEEDEDEEESEETEGEEEAEGEEGSEDGEEEGEEGEGSEEPQGKAADKKDGEGEKPDGQQQQQPKPEGRVPPGKLREANERARAAEAERDTLRQQLEDAKKPPATDPKVAALETQVATLTQLLQGQGRPAPAKTAEPAEPTFEADSLFENPKGFVDHITSIVQKAVAPLAQQQVASRVETSLAIAHATHKGTFDDAFAALNGLNPQDPNDRSTVQRIYNSSNPGEELVKWHKRTTALAHVGDDPTAYEERIRTETRTALLKDPEFRKQLIADMRGEAAQGNNGAPRNETRLPKSLARSGGSNLGADRPDNHAREDSEQSVADAAWRT